MPTYIDGIGASENIDSSGERIIIAGLDISSLDKDGIFNYEHKNDQPSQIVGKVLKAKKIFSDKDCEDDRQKYYWEKVQVPYLYVMGELFDDFKDSSKDVAGMFRYDAAKRGQNERNVMNFSVEGAKISKEGMDITRSIARKITITVLPCNKMAIAEMVPSSAKQPKDDVDSIFKTESMVEIELLKSDDPMVKLEMFKREDPNKHAKQLGIRPMTKDSIGGGLSMGASSALSGVSPSSSGGVLGGEGMMRAEKKPAAKNPNGIKIGRTKSGRDIMSHGKVAEYGFNALEHADAAAAHEKAAQAAKDPRLGRHHWDKSRMHYSAGQSGMDAHRRQRATDKQIAAKPQGGARTLSGPSTVYDPAKSGKVNYKKSEMAKGDPRTPSAKDQASWPQHPKQSARPRGQYDPDVGVHSEYDARGQSMAGMAVRHPMSGQPKGSGQAEAKQMHREKLVELKAMPKPKLTKALGAGSMNAAPGQLSGGAALGKESLMGKMQKPVKSKWLKRAEEEYEKWEKREHFRSFMQKRLPHLKMHEIDAFGKALALNKAMRAEKALAKIGGAAGDQPGMHSWVAKKEKK